jgi:hypothetical protein
MRNEEPSELQSLQKEQTFMGENIMTENVFIM